MLICLAGVLCALTVFLINASSASPSAGENKHKKVLNGGKAVHKKAKLRLRQRKKAKHIDGEDTAAGEGAEGAEKKKPTFALDDDDEAKLNAEQLRTIMAIREALGNDDRKTVLKLVQTLQKSKEWPDGIPKSIKLAAIEALGWFGQSCLPELAGFLGDTDEEVVQAAIDRYQEMLADVELSDYERSEIILQASKIINNSDAMDSMLFELNNMRHSVAIETIKRLMVEGGPATASILPGVVEFYTGEEDVLHVEKLDDWLKRNPDEPGDAEFYGGSKERASADDAANRR